MAVVAEGGARWLGQVRDRQRDVMAWSHGNTETVTVLATSWHLARILFVFCDIIRGGVGGAGRGGAGSIARICAAPDTFLGRVNENQAWSSS